MEQSKLERSELENLKLHYLNLYTLILNEQVSTTDHQLLISIEIKRIYIEDQLREVCLKLKKVK